MKSEPIKYNWLIFIYIAFILSYTNKSKKICLLKWLMLFVLGLLPETHGMWYTEWKRGIRRGEYGNVCWLTHDLVRMQISVRGRNYCSNGYERGTLKKNRSIWLNDWVLPLSPERTICICQAHSCIRQVDSLNVSLWVKFIHHLKKIKNR